MSGAGKLEMASSPYDPLGDIPVLDLIEVGFGIWDNDMLPGRVVARVNNPLSFARHAMFKQDYVGWALDSDALPPPLKRRAREKRWKALQELGDLNHRNRYLRRAPVVIVGRQHDLTQIRYVLDDDLSVPALELNGHPGEEGFAGADVFSEFVEHSGGCLRRHVEDQQLRMIEPEQTDRVRKRWTVFTGAGTSGSRTRISTNVLNEPAEAPDRGRDVRVVLVEPCLGLRVHETPPFRPYGWGVTESVWLSQGGDTLRDMKAERLLNRIFTGNVKNVRFRDMTRLCERLGFLSQRTTGSQHIFSKPTTGSTGC